ncbi:DNA polymerase III subunit beta [Pelagibacteraceae bacterium]|nr:DNA polymerase III subunit beta [Pelagibacteraceae bacterium]
MQFLIKRDVLLKSLSLVQGIVEKKNTLPILSNVLLETKGNKLSIIATDLDLVFFDEINEVNITKDGSTTTSATILYDILRKISANSEIQFELKSENKLNLKTENSNFNLLCLPTDNFPNFSDNFDGPEIKLNKSKLLSMLNKAKISISNDDTRHYLNGIFIHITESQNKKYLTGVATDSHRLSSSSIEVEKSITFPSLILPRKTVFQLCSLIQESSENIVIQNNESKIKFKIGNVTLTSKVIDGKFPDYRQVVPTDNKKQLKVLSKELIDSVERVTTVSIDRKEGVKMIINKDNVKLSVNSTSSGEGNEIIKAYFSSEELIISFNSKYLIDIASQIEAKNLMMNFKDSVSPVLIEDDSDKNSYYVIMPMKI